MDRVTIGQFVYDCVDEVDVVGPWEVLTVWRLLAAGEGAGTFCGAPQSSPVKVLTFALPTNGNPVTCAKGLRIVPDDVWGSPNMPQLDVIIYPGGPDMGPQIDPDDPRYDPAYGEMARSVRDQGALPVSVCVGALAYAHFGMLRERRATTHWMAVKKLLELDGTIEFEPSRFVDAGDVITSAGISASIDLALHLVARLDSPERAREVRRYIEYDPAPPVSMLIAEPPAGAPPGAVGHPAHRYVPRPATTR